MKIAAITISYNDDFKLNEWYNHYLEYKNELFLHIIVDNNSKKPYLEIVKKYFNQSIIINRKTNGGCTLAYNDGIKYALSNKDVDAIMLIGNDMHIKNGDISKLYKYLFSNNAFGMVAPIILKKDSNIIESVGCIVSPLLYLDEPFVNEDVDTVHLSNFKIEAVAGGMNLATRKFYEKVGLQDENLFMYSDEVDMAIRTKKEGMAMSVLCEAKAWHQHINPPGNRIRPAYTGYLIGRNKVYLGYKHFGFLKAFSIFSFHIYRFFGGLVKSIFSKERLNFHLYFFLGSLSGIFRIEKNFKFIIDNE